MGSITQKRVVCREISRESTVCDMEAENTCYLEPFQNIGRSKNTSNTLRQNDTVLDRKSIMLKFENFRTSDSSIKRKPPGSPRLARAPENAHTVISLFCQPLKTWSVYSMIATDRIWKKKWSEIS